MKEKGIGNLIYSVVLLIVCALISAFSAAAVIEYCNTAPADSAAWLAVTTGVAAIGSGLFVAVFVIVGIWFFRKAQRFRALPLVSAILLAASWVFLLCCPAASAFFYDVSSPHIRVAADEAQALGALYCEKLTSLAETRGDAIVLYAGRDETTALSDVDYASKYAADVTCGEETFTLSFRYDAGRKKLDVTLHYDYNFPEGDAPDWTMLDAPLAYLNCVTARTFTREELAETAEGKGGAFNQSWDGTCWMKRYDDRCTIEVFPGRSATETQRFETYQFTVTAWTDTEDMV